jgi:hypothetical protein
MKILQRFLMGLGTVLLVALALQLVAPKAVHAVVSTLVTVANTAANPVPIDADADARNTVVLYSIPNVNSFASLEANQFFDSVTGNPYVVPTGKRLVVDDVSAEVLTSAANPPSLSLFVGLTADGPPDFAPIQYTAFIPLGQPAQRANGFSFVAHEKTHLVAGPGAILQSGQLGGVLGSEVIAVGHLVDCSSGCNNF